MAANTEAAGCHRQTVRRGTPILPALITGAGITVGAIGACGAL